MINLVLLSEYFIRRSYGSKHLSSEYWEDIKRSYDFGEDRKMYKKKRLLNVVSRTVRQSWRTAKY